MSYDNPRIDLSDSLLDIIMKMAEGNPGAINVLAKLVESGPKIDRNSAFPELGAIMGLDNADIYGSKIWMLYKDVCGQNIEKMIAVLRGVQLGLIGDSQLQDAINGRLNFSVDSILEQVRGRLDLWTSPNMEVTS